MKLFKKLIFIFLSIGALISCDGMDATYKEFIEEGPIVYIGKVDSLKAYAGRNRVMLEWQKLLDPRAKTAKIFWENRTKSTELQLTDKATLTQVVVEDLAEGSYVFEICTYDTYGNSSIMSEVPCAVYGDVYEKLLFNTKVKTAVLKNDVLTVTFAASLEPTFFASEITYMSSEGKNKTVLLKAPATQVKIDDFAGDHITYRSVYLPEETAIEEIAEITKRIYKVIFLTIELYESLVSFVVTGTTNGTRLFFYAICINYPIHVSFVYIILF